MVSMEVMRFPSKMPVHGAYQLLCFGSVPCCDYHPTVMCVCEGYGGQMSDCTAGFPTLFHIDKVAGNTGLETEDRRQVVIPDINFSCNGTITRWIVGAKWEGNIDTYTELQIWRRTSTTNQYMKVNGISIMVSGITDSTKIVYTE